MDSTPVCHAAPHMRISLIAHIAATLHATFFESSAAHPPAPKADVIIPVSTLANNTGNDASVPPTFSVGAISSITCFCSR